MTVNDVAKKLKVTPQYVRKLISDGKLEAARIGSQWVVSPNDLSFDESKASLSTWIYTITRNTVIDYFRTIKIHIEFLRIIAIFFVYLKTCNFWKNIVKYICYYVLIMGYYVYLYY